MASILTAADLAQQVKKELNETWEIHVDERVSHQIPAAPSIRRARNVRTWGLYCTTSKPVKISVYLFGVTLPALKKMIDAGELWEEIRKEFESKSQKWTRQSELERIGKQQSAIGGRQLALTYSSNE